MKTLKLRSDKQVNISLKKAIRVTGVTLALLLFCIPAYSQVNLGRISGTVTDQTGGAVAGATVTVLDVARGVPRVLTTDNAGAYSAPNLIPGAFTVRVEAAGFNILERKDVTVGVGQETRVDLSLQPGSQQQTVTVTGEAPLVNTSNAQLEGDISTDAVSDLPINGRQYRTLLATVPGLVATPGTGNNKEMGFEGTRPENLVYLIDGVYSVNPHAGTPTVGGNTAGGGPDQSTILPVDAIQEVNVIGNPNAEYGWKPGAQINIGLKSGTNELHGTAFAFGRDGVTDAKNPFLTAAQPKAAAELEQYGFSIGGPIKKDKLFYFGSYEAQHFSIGTPKGVNEPTTASLVSSSLASGDSTNSFPDAIADVLKNHATTALSQLSLNMAGCPTVATLNALPITTSTTAQLAGMISCNAADGLFVNSAGSRTFTDTLTDSGGSKNVIAKVDYHLNEHNSLNAEFYYGNGSMYYPGSAVSQYWAVNDPTTADLIRGVWIWTPNSTWLNEARFGYDRSGLNSYPGDCAGAGATAPNYQSAFGFVSGVQNHPTEFYGPCSFPNLTISQFTALGTAASAPSLLTYGSYEASDVVSYTRGKHLFKFGFDFRKTSGLTATFTQGRGSVTFGTAGVNAFAPPFAPTNTGTATPLEDFLGGAASTASVLNGDPLVNLSFKAYGAFFQDDFRITSKLTLNLGLRWEGDPPIWAGNNQAGAFDPTSSTGMRQQTSGRAIYNGDYINFAPRIGIAYDLTGKGTTVIRASGGITYDTTPYFLELINSAFIQEVPTNFTLFNPDGSMRPNTGTISVGQVNYNSSQLKPNWGVNSSLFPASTPSCSNGIPNAAIPTTFNPAPCLVAVIDPNFRMGRVYNWLAALQHAFTNNTSMTISYVGNHGSHLGGTVDLNQPTLGPLGTGSGATSTAAIEQQRRPYYNQFPYLGQITSIESSENSSYNSLIVTVAQRVTKGLGFTANYALAHSIEQTPFETGLVMDSTHPNLDRGDGAFDTRHRLTLTGSYDIPGVKSPGQMLEGWGVDTNLNMFTGFPWNAVDTTSDYSGTAEANDRWTLVGNPKDFKAGAVTPIPCWGVNAPVVSSFAKAANCTKVGSIGLMPEACIFAATNEPIHSSVPGSSGMTSLASAGCYIMGNSVIVPPAQGTFGSMAKDALRVPAFIQWDLAMRKEWKIKERLTTQFRAEFYNVLNNTHYAAPTTASGSPASPSNFGTSLSTPETANPVIGTGSPRKVQFALKFQF